jgi:hypothetical protein
MSMSDLIETKYRVTRKLSVFLVFFVRRFRPQTSRRFYRAYLQRVERIMACIYS